MPSKNCFFIMPFQNDLNFFYLYMQHYISKKHSLHVERGDHKILTISLLEKIKQHIRDADIIIGDITGRNPNVFYELGIADALEKPVILITQDESADVPTDIKHLEHIPYCLSNHEEIISNIDNALHHAFKDRYDELYKRSMVIYREFSRDTSTTYAMCSRQEFQARVTQSEKKQQSVRDESEFGVAAYLLPKIVLETEDFEVMNSMTSWLNKKHS